MRARRFRRLVAALLPVVVPVMGLAACSGGGGDDGASESTEPSSTAPASCLPRSSTVARASAPEVEEDGDFMLLVGTDLIQLDTCSDRMTFTFVPTAANVPPPYQVSYVDEPPLPGQFIDDDPADTTTTVPSTDPETGEEVEGEPERVDVSGDAWLIVTFGNTSGFDLREDPPSDVYEGPPEWTPGILHVVEAQMINDLDQTVVWVIGVTGGQRPFTIDSTIDPDPENPTSTITIDIA